ETYHLFGDPRRSEKPAGIGDDRLIPCSLIVGTSGKAARRFSVRAAIGRSFPAMIYSFTSWGCGIMICTFPAKILAILSLTAGVEIKLHLAPVALRINRPVRLS